MQFIRWFCILTVAFGVYSIDNAWSADPLPNHLKASEALVDTLDLNRSIMNMILFSFPQQAHDIIKYVLGKETGLWDAMRKDVSIIYAEIFTENELKELTVFFKSDIGKKWIDSQAEFSRRSLLTLQKKESFIRQTVILSCVAAILVPIIDGYKKRAGITSEGILPEIMSQLEPLIKDAKKTCVCAVDEAGLKWGLENLQSKLNSPEFGEFMNYLFTSGKCPVPGK